MKTIIKTAVFVLLAVLMIPLILSYKFLSILSNQDSLLAGYSQLLSLLPGKTGSYLRAAFYRFTLTRCAPNALISFGVLLSQQDTEIEEGVYIGPHCNIGRCRIGNNTLLGSGVHIMSGKGQHNFDDPDKPIKDQGGTFTKVHVGANCWLGNGALIMASIGDNSVVAAGAVVVSDVPSHVVVAGNPARVIRQK